MDTSDLNRRSALLRLGLLGVAAAFPSACSRGSDAAIPEQNASAAGADARPPKFVPPDPEDERRLHAWVATLRDEGFADPASPLGRAAIRTGELARGTPYEAYTLEAYIREGGSPARTEPLTVSLTRFDCVSLVESCLAVARVARSPETPSWDRFAREMEKMRYRGGDRGNYASRLHYFSEWLNDNESRGLVRTLGERLGGSMDPRPLRFMTENADAYPALENPSVLAQIAEMEQRLDDAPRWLVPTALIPEIVDQLETGDILGFGTSIPGLDVTHAAFAYRADDDVMHVLHAPLSGGVVETTRSTLPAYVAAINRSTGILVGRPLDG